MRTRSLQLNLQPQQPLENRLCRRCNQPSTNYFLCNECYEQERLECSQPLPLNRPF